MVKTSLIVLITAGLTALSILVRDHWFPNPSNQVSYYFLSLILSGSILTVIFIFRLALIALGPRKIEIDNGRPHAGDNKRESFRLHFPEDDRPKMVVEQSRPNARRHLQLEVLDMSESGLSLTGNDLIHLNETIFGKILFSGGENLRVAGTVVYQQTDKIGLNLHCFIPHAIYMKEQRRLLAMDRGTEFVPIPKTPFSRQRIRTLLSNRINRCPRKPL
jgi:hypothetical protein